METGAAWGAGLELRRQRDGGVRLSGRFAYGVAAVLTDGGRTGRPKKEIIAPRAFAYRIETPSDHGGPKEIHLLAGHDYGKPLASVRSGTLRLRDTAAALLFEAVITAAVADTSHGSDALALLEAGLQAGISPGFRLPPERAVPRQEAETIEEEDPAEGLAIIRTIRAALLYELSLVTRPAYPETAVEMQRAAVQRDGGGPKVHPLARWRL